MESLYEDLGATPADSQETLQRRYRQRAREFHPDVNPDPGADAAMRRLNHAWAVLGDPSSRRDYDRQLLEAAPTRSASGPVAASAPPPPFHEPDPALLAPVPIPWPWKIFRPSVLIPLVLLAIFVGTAYAGHVGPQASNPGSSTTPGISPLSTLMPATPPIGRCVTRQADGLTTVPCSQPNDGQVVAEVKFSNDCPPGAVAAPDPAFSAVACLEPHAP
jgi:hypothetical protein